MQSALIIGSAALLGLASGECTALTQPCDPSLSLIACNALSGFGCQYSNNECSGADCTSYVSATECAGAALNGCSWNEPGQCSGADIYACAAPSSEYSTCLSASATNGGVDICNCLPKYFSCINAGECKNFVGLLDTCSSTVNLIATAFQQTCDTDWCDFGSTLEESELVIAFTFTNPSSGWTQQQLQDFESALDTWLPVDSAWRSFDAATGELTITIPPNTVISSSQLSNIQPSIAAITGTSAAASVGVEDTEVVSAKLSPVSSIDSASSTELGVAAVLATAAVLL